MTHTQPGLRLFAAGMITVLGCGLEPDEIDFASMSDSGSEGADGTATGDGDFGDGDNDTGDGDGDPGDGDGDPDPGDGDGDPGDGDGDPGDGDGDGDPGDGDGDGVPCGDLPAEALELGDNDVTLQDVMSTYSGSCGGDGPDALFSFTAPADGTYTFSLTSNEFEGQLYLVGPSCDPLHEIDCGPEDLELQLAMIANDVVYILVDSNLDPGAGVVSIGVL